MLGKMNKKILIINKYFYPGYKAGGPIQSLKNMCDALQGYFDISVLTRDRDFLDKHSYRNIVPGVWTDVNSYKVFYTSDKGIRKSTIKRVVEETNPDLIYLSSFFDKISISAIQVAKEKSIPVVLAPRGEFSAGALKIRKLKKMTFFKIADVIGLYENVTYHSTNEFESKDIERVMGRVPVFISENLVKSPLNKIHPKPYDEELWIAYVSRVTPKKNLLFFLEFLAKLFMNKKITFNIYGPIDDEKYWNKCSNAIAKLGNPLVKVIYHGAVSPNRFEEIYKQTHFSILPTHGENFGHSIYESLAHGVPVIISDKTPWTGLEDKKAGFDANITDSDLDEIFIKIGEMRSDEYVNYCHGALRLADDYYKSLDVESITENFTRLMK